MGSVQPRSGNQFSMKAKDHRRISPIQKDGMLLKNRLLTTTDPSLIRPRRQGMNVPMTIPKTKVRTDAGTKRTSVLGKASAITAGAARPSRNDGPTSTAHMLRRNLSIQIGR